VLLIAAVHNTIMTLRFITQAYINSQIVLVEITIFYE